jgi:hypothetical protein
MPLCPTCPSQSSSSLKILGPGHSASRPAGKNEIGTHYCRDHPLACIQRASNSARFCSAATPSIPAEEVSFDASNWHSTLSRRTSLSRPRSELSPPGRTQVVAQPATQAATAKTPIIIGNRPTTGPRRNTTSATTTNLRELRLGQPLRALHAHIAVHIGAGRSPSSDAAHSPLMPAALMIGHHFSISAFCNAPSAAGVCSSRGGN